MIPTVSSEAVLLTDGTDCSSVEAVWVGLRQRRTSGPLEWTDENTIPYSMHYDGKLSADCLSSAIISCSIRHMIIYCALC